MVKDAYKPSTVAIPNAAAAVTGLAAIWTNIDKLATYPWSLNSEKVKSLSCEIAVKSQVFLLRADLLLFDPLLRKLINESCGLFVSAANLRRTETKNGLPINQLLKHSRKYRSVLRESIENIQDENSRLNPAMNNQRFDNCIALLYNIEFIWHLTEVLYITSIADDIALPHITQWIRFHFPDYERNARKILQSIKDGKLGFEHRTDFLNEGVENSFTEYWDTVTGLILQGNVELARILLQLHSQSDSETFNQADRVLRNMPVYNAFSELSLQEFNMQWKIWQSNAGKKLASAVFDECQHLKFIIQVMSGDVNSYIEKLKSRLPSWYQAMVAALLYTEPLIKFYELSYHAHRYVKQYGGTAVLNFCDTTVLALFELDINSAVRKFQLTSDGGWLATHLTHLLTLCGKLELQVTENEDDENESSMERLDLKLILEYGTLLMSHRSLWQIGLCYLDQCPSGGSDRQQILLSKIVPTSDMKAIKLINAALCRGLVEVAASVCKVQGVKCLRRKQLGKALEWAFRSQDAAFASHLADQFLQHYVSKGVFDSTDLLDNLGSCMLICDRLTFLGKYCEFRRLYLANKLKESSTCLSDLIASRIAPKYFWLTLLNDALPLLEHDCDEPLFDSRQTSSLMHCLNELCSLNEGKMSSLLSSAQSSSFDKTVGLIRLAICKNMAKTISTESLIENRLV